MRKNFRATINKLKREEKTKRGRCILYLHKENLKAFRKLCEIEGESASKVIDAWIEEALQEGSKKR